MTRSYVPLADSLRPKLLDQMVGQSHLLGKEGWISKIIDKGKPLSILLYGPSGCGKTTLGRLYARNFDAKLLAFSATEGGISEIKKHLKEHKKAPLLAKPLILFIDEIHRFNKAQQDALLPYVEDGSFTLIGATTENPSFSLNNALLSRMQTLILHPLSQDDLHILLERFPSPLPLTEEAKKLVIEMAGGDARYLYNILESLQLASKEKLLDRKDIPDWVQRRAPLYDKKDEGHYNLISALHKSIRGSDGDAALYWLARMLQGGENPQFIARRLIRMASEDIGLADPSALPHALDAAHAYDRLGSPEGELALAQATLYLALAPKSNATYLAFQQAFKLAEKTGEKNPPKTILNAQTTWMKEQGYGKGYAYDHDTKEGLSGQNYFPEGIDRPSFYEPISRGFEREMRKRLLYFAKLREDKKKPFQRPKIDTSTETKG